MKRGGENEGSKRRTWSANVEAVSSRVKKGKENETNEKKKWGKNESRKRKKKKNTDRLKNFGAAEARSGIFGALVGWRAGWRQGNA